MLSSLPRPDRVGQRAQLPPLGLPACAAGSRTASALRRSPASRQARAQESRARTSPGSQGERLLEVSAAAADSPRARRTCPSSTGYSAFVGSRRIASCRLRTPSW